MPRIFVNYRTGDEEHCATLVERELSRVFGSSNVFRASKSIAAGQPFEQAILREVWRSDALIAVIGPRWLTASRGGAGSPRMLDDPEDWTRREIVEALEHDVTVIPLLVGPITMPRRDEVPDALAPMLGRQYVRYDHRRPDDGLRQLVEQLGGRPAHGTDGADSPAEPPGGIGSVTGTRVNAVGHAAGPVHLGSGHQVTQSGVDATGATFVFGDTNGRSRRRKPGRDDA